MVEPDGRETKPSQKGTKTINLGTKDEVKKVKVGAKLAKEEKERRIHVLYEFMDVFIYMVLPSYA